MRERFPAVAASIPRARRAVERFTARHGLLADRTDDLRLAVTEAMTNAVLHAYDGRDAPGTIDVVCALDGGALTVVCRDHGAGMRRRPDSPGLGLGMSLMEQSCDALQIAGAPGGGTEVRLVYRLGARV